MRVKSITNYWLKQIMEPLVNSMLMVGFSRDNISIIDIKKDNVNFFTSLNILNFTRSGMTILESVFDSLIILYFIWESCLLKSYCKRKADI